MNTEGHPPARYRHYESPDTATTAKYDEAPLEDMFDELEEFAEIIGGKPWRTRRARTTAIQRTVELYLDESYEQLPLQKRKFDRELDGELIDLEFSATRVDIEGEGDPEDEDDFDKFKTMYRLEYSVGLPLPDLSSVPDEYRRQIEAFLEEDEEKLRESGAPAYLPPPAPSVIERHTVEYVIDSYEEMIDISEAIEYTGGDFTVTGPSYDSTDFEATAVHHPDMDKLNAEYTSADGTIEPEQCENIGDRLLALGSLEVLMYDPAAKIELLGRSSEEHAVRVLALLGIIRQGFRRPS